MSEFDLRFSRFISQNELSVLKKAGVAIFGLGGVGSPCVEILSRLAVGNFFLVDGDVYEKSNTNRQLYAITSTYTKPKVTVAKRRIKSINIDTKVKAQNSYLDDDNAKDIFKKIDHFRKALDSFVIIDAIDDKNAKILIYKYALQNNIDIISSMGAARKKFASSQIATLDKTFNCPLARRMREICKKEKINANYINVVFDSSLPLKSEKIIKSSILSTFDFALKISSFSYDKLTAR